MAKKPKQPIELVHTQKQGVLNVVTHQGYLLLDRQEQLVEKFWRKNMTIEEARHEARRRIPDPPRVSFVQDTAVPLSSPIRQYGHAGYYDLFEELLDAGSYRHAGGIIRVYNLDQWELPTPTDDVIAAIFGEDAVPFFRQYRKRHGY